MSDLSNGAKLARKTLRILFLPVMITVAVTRFTPFRWYWLDLICLALLLLMVILAVIGRVFTSKSKTEASN